MKHFTCVTPRCSANPGEMIKRSRNSNFSVLIQMKPKSQCEFVPRDTKESEFLDLADFGDVTFSVETVMHEHSNTCVHMFIFIGKCFHRRHQQPVVY